MQLHSSEPRFPANATVINPIITTFNPKRTLAVRVPDLVVVTGRQGISIQKHDGTELLHC